MKITCQSCQAKYTIADEKVAGKTVKIKCKKCGAAIVVHGTDLAAQAAPPAVDPHAPRPAEGADDDEGETRVFTGSSDSAAPPSADEWTVNVADDDQRTMTTAQVADEYRRGTLSPDTYVWKDGMSDWLPLSNVPEFANIGTSVPPAAAAPVPAPAAAAASPFAAAASPLAAAPAAAAAAPAAARRQGGRSAGVDLFGAQQEPEPPPPAAPPAHDRLVGERNENSVLFSLAALTAAETAAKVQKKDDVASFGGSGRNNGRSGLDDIMNIGGGGLGGPMLAPPPLLAPVVEAPPPPAPVATAAPIQPGLVMPVQQPKRGAAGIIIGVVAGMAVMGIIGFFVFRPPSPSSTTTPEGTATTAQTATAAPAETASAATTAATAPPAPTESATAEATTDAPQDKPTTVAAAGPVGPARPTADKPADKPEDKPAPTAEKPAEKPAETAASSDAPFNRGAATSALGGAAGAAKSCKKPDGPTGSGRVRVTFAPSGRVTSAQVQGSPFAGTSVGGCVAGVFRGARVPPFSGSPVTVSKSFSIN